MKKKKQLNKDNTGKWITPIAILFVAVVPLLIRIIALHYPMDQFTWHPNDTVFYDSYSLFKSQVILVLGALSTGLLLYRQYKFKPLSFKDPVVTTALIFMGFIIISHFVSINSFVSNKGYLERYESTWIWLSYIIVFLLVYSFKWDKESLRKLVFAFIISNIFLSIIGIFQYIGIDLIFNDFMKPFITGSNMRNVNFTATSTINYKVIVQTLYHYNYVGHYIALSFPFILSLALYERELIKKIFLFVLLGFVTINLLGSSARGGLVAILITLPLVILINYKIFFKNIKFSIALIITLAVLFVGFEAYSDQFITKRLVSIFTSVESSNRLQDIQIEEDSIFIDLEGKSFEVNILSQLDDKWSVEYFLDGEPIQATDTDGDRKLNFDIPVLKNVEIYMIKQEENLLLTIDIYGTPWYFGYNNDKLMYSNPYGKYDTIITPEKYGFEGRERLGSARGYIWSRSIPLALNKPLTGHGPDTFALIFPQNDYIGKYNVYNTNNMIVDKPHNLFLQIAINSGFIALGAYLLLYVILGKRLLGNWVRQNKSFDNVYLSSFALSVFSYFFAGFFNDSSVHVSTVFWIFLALALQQLKPDYEMTT